VGEVCTAEGGCGGGRPRDCTGVISVAECQANAACDEAAGQCTFVAVNAGSACTSPNFCVVNATCTAAGGCEGSARDCSSARTEPACQGTPVCNAAASRCEGPPANNGGVCDDGLLCTSNDRCSGGVCGGSEVACGTATACRAAGICDELTGTCSGAQQPDRTSCPVTNGFGICTTGECGITSCRGGFANCDASVVNGCETPVDTDPNNCGGCGVTCTGSQFTGVCTSGYCELESGTTWTYCETPRRGSTPVNLVDDAENCGVCGNRCGALSDCAFRACTLVPMEFVQIEAGTFQMGSPVGELGRSTEETQHRVTLTRDFLVARTEVTQGQWEEIMNTNPDLLDAPNLPMGLVNWWDAVAFANALSISQGLPACYVLVGCWGTPGTNYSCDNIGVNASGSNPLLCTGYRLPTEAEWEYAYRAGTTSAFYSGDITFPDYEPLDLNLNEIGWYGGNSVVGGSFRAQLVGGKGPNAWGLYDMAGNHFEWCWDWWDLYPGTVSDPLGPTIATGARVIRGGSYGLYAYWARASYRSSPGNPAVRDFAAGFRLARTAP
jgi:formylglycine-generating enzyme required for sulfatase activity